MDFNAWVGLFAFLIMLGFIVLGVPIFISVLVVTLAGSFIVGGLGFTLQQFAAEPYHVSSTYTFAVVPLFVLMSGLAADCGLGDAAYEAAYKWFGKMRGGLLIATVFASAIFGAASGTFLATVAVFGKVALPQLDKYKYDKPYSMGCIAASGTIDVLIPPSVPIIIFCILLDVSIGRALFGAIVPGLLLTVLMCIAIVVIGIMKPGSMPRATDIQISWRERFSSLKLVVPIMLVILVVLGGMYLGVFAPTAAGAIGSAAVLLIALIKRTKLKTISNSFIESILVNTQIFVLLIAGFLFARFILMSGLTDDLMALVAGANMHPLLLMLVVIIFYLFIGCVLEFLSMAIITLPIIYPLLLQAGFDPIATIIVIIMLSQIATITPPFGMACFVMASVAGVPSEMVFRGTMPFLIVCLLLTFMIIFFPEIVTWLPDLLYGKG